MKLLPAVCIKCECRKRGKCPFIGMNNFNELIAFCLFIPPLLSGQIQAGKVPLYPVDGPDFIPMNPDHLVNNLFEKYGGYSRN